MEDDAVILVLERQLLDLRHVLGRELGIHLDRDPPVLEIDIERVVLVRVSVGRLVPVRLRPGAADGQKRGEESGDEGQTHGSP